MEDTELMEPAELVELDPDIEDLDRMEDPKPDYTNSCALDIHLYSNDLRVTAASRALCSEIEYAGGRAETHMRVVLLNLYWTNHMSPDRWVGYSRDNNRYGIPFRYNPQRIEVHPLNKVVKGLIGRGYVEPLNFHYNGKPGEGRCSRMRATAKLISFLVERHQFRIDVVGRHPDEEVIVLKDTQEMDKKVIWYDDNRETPKMRKFLNQYNEFIQKTYIDLDYMGYVHNKQLRNHSPEYRAKLPSNIFIDLTKRKMRRIFNNKSFTQGGRYYGGFWMEMPSQLRLRLIIEMQKVIEADYSGIHIHLLYNQNGIDYGAYNRDPYEIPGYPNTPKHRNLFKKLLLAAINAQADAKSTGETKAIKALREDINYNRSDYPDELPSLREVLDDFRSHHAPIAEYLCSGRGLKLMYQDSQIAEHVMKAMFKLRIPVLPVHDSFICPKQYGDTLIDAMTYAYQHVTGSRLTRTQFTVRIKEPDEWNRAEGNELFPDEDYYFDPQYTEDDALIRHMYNIDRTEMANLEEGVIIEEVVVAPHVLNVSIPINYS